MTGLVGKSFKDDSPRMPEGHPKLPKAPSESQGYINGYKYQEGFANQGAIKIALKYRRDSAPVIAKVERVSTPGKREYFKSETSRG